MRCPPPPARGRGRLELVAGPGPWSFRPPSRSAKLLLFAAEATALQSSVCATPAEPGRCHAHRAQSGPRQRYEPRAARAGRDAGDTVLTPREPLRPGPTAQGAGRPRPTAHGDGWARATELCKDVDIGARSNGFVEFGAVHAPSCPYSSPPLAPSSRC